MPTAKHLAQPMTYTCTLLRAGRLLLDAGGMFGLIPRVVWETMVDPDDKHRVELHHNCLWLVGTQDDPELGRPRQVVIEAGTGDKLDPKMAGIFGLDGRTVETALTEAGGDPAKIDDVIISHLHFDHAGGLTRRLRPGESPDWTAGPKEASGDASQVKLTFPNATIHVQEKEWHTALAGDSVMTRTYYTDHLAPIESKLRLHDSPRPFEPGRVPHKDEHPALPWGRRTTTILPGIKVFLTPGHTWGQQAMWFINDKNRQIVFTPDVMPTAWHSGKAYSLAYDVEPYTSMVTKTWLLREAAERGWTLVLDHEPGDPWRRVKPNDRGWYALEPAGDA